MTRLGQAPLRQTIHQKWVTAFALLAFLLQGLATQTHIHQFAQPPRTSAASPHQQAPAPLKSQDPVDQCRLCQELAQAGSVIAPSASSPPSSLTFVAAAFTMAPFFAGALAPAFAWQSRAPPRH